MHSFMWGCLLKKIKYKGHVYVRADSTLIINDWNIPKSDFTKVKQLMDKALQEVRRKSYNYEHYVDEAVHLLADYRS